MYANNYYHLSPVIFSITDNVDHEEAKSLFEKNYSHVYFILYDTFIQAEANLKQKGKVYLIIILFKKSKCQKFGPIKTVKKAEFVFPLNIENVQKFLYSRW